MELPKAGREWHNIERGVNHSLANPSCFMARSEKGRWAMGRRYIFALIPTFTYLLIENVNLENQLVLFERVDLCQNCPTKS
jgi:hypothetical protein